MSAKNAAPELPGVSMPGQGSPETTALTAVPPAAGPVRVIGSQGLFAGGRVLHIRHGQEVYTLRITRQDKLVLTK